MNEHPIGAGTFADRLGGQPDWGHERVQMEPELPARFVRGNDHRGVDVPIAACLNPESMQAGGQSACLNLRRSLHLIGHDLDAAQRVEVANSPSGSGRLGNETAAGEKQEEQRTKPAQADQWLRNRS